MQNHDKIIDRIQKLLALATSSNVNEAAAAAAAAQRLMTAHGIEQAMLAEQTPAEAREEALEDSAMGGNMHGRKATWQGVLAATLAQVNGCGAYWQGGQLRVLGPASKARTVTYLQHYLVREVDRLCAAQGAGRGRSWANSFRLGAVSVLSQRLREAAKAARTEARAEAVAGGASIVLVDRALARVDNDLARVKERFSKMQMRAARSSNARIDYDGAAAGRAAGHSIRLDSGPALGAGSSGHLKG